MRRLSAICLMLLLLAAGLFAEDGAVAMRFKLLEAEFYTLDSYYSSELGRLYTKAEFAIPKAELDPMAYYGFFWRRIPSSSLSQYRGSLKTTILSRIWIPPSLSQLYRILHCCMIRARSVFMASI